MIPYIGKNSRNEFLVSTLLYVEDAPTKAIIKVINPNRGIYTTEIDEH